METTPGLFTYEVMGAKSKDIGFAQSRCSCKAQTKDSAMMHGLSAATQQMRRKRTQLAAICIQNKEEKYGQYFSVRPCSNRRSYGCKEQGPWVCTESMQLQGANEGQCYGARPECSNAANAPSMCKLLAAEALAEVLEPSL